MSSYFVEYYKTLFVVLSTTILTDDAFLFSRKCVVYFIECRIMLRGFVFGLLML